MNPFDQVIFLWMVDGDVACREHCRRWQAWVYFCVLFALETTQMNLHRASCRILTKS